MAYMTRTPRTRFPAIAAVTLVHAALGYALISGLASTAIETFTQRLEVTNIPMPAPAADPEPLPQTERKLTPIDQPKAIVTVPTPAPLPITPAPLPTLDLPTAGGGIVSLPTPIDIAPTPPPARPGPATAARPRGDRAGWITTEDYPSGAIRAGEEGSVGIQAAIDPDGRVLACKVTASSGPDALDAATCRLYIKRGRFTPARDDQGNAVASTTNDRIRWQLPD